MTKGCRAGGNTRNKAWFWDQVGYTSLSRSLALGLPFQGLPDELAAIPLLTVLDLRSLDQLQVAVLYGVVDLVGVDDLKVGVPSDRSLGQEGDVVGLLVPAEEVQRLGTVGVGRHEDLTAKVSVRWSVNIRRSSSQLSDPRKINLLPGSQRRQTTDRDRLKTEEPRQREYLLTTLLSIIRLRETPIVKELMNFTYDHTR